MDRREFQRITISAASVFVLNNNESISKEFTGTIKDISEGGIKIEFTKDEVSLFLPYLKVGDSVRFQGVDEYELFGDSHSDIFIGEAVIKRKTVLDDTVLLGCQFTDCSKELRDYITNRKTSSYMKSLKYRQYLS